MGLRRMATISRRFAAAGEGQVGLLKEFDRRCLGTSRAHAFKGKPFSPQGEEGFVTMYEYESFQAR